MYILKINVHVTVHVHVRYYFVSITLFLDVGLTLRLIEVLHCVRYSSISRGSYGWKFLELQLARYMNIGTVYQENFALLNFCENGDFNNYLQIIFLQMIHVGNIKGVAWQYFVKFNFTKFVKIKRCENSRYTICSNLPLFSFFFILYVP